MKLALATLALVPLAVLTGPARAATDPTGFLCGFTSHVDPTDLTGARQVGELDGGPLAIVDESGAPLTGRLSCTVQVGLADSRHADPDAARATGPETTGVVVVPPTPVTFPTSPDGWYHVCAEVAITGGATLYWDTSNDPTVEGHWSTDPVTARCEQVPPPGPDCRRCPPAWEPEWIVESILCPVTALVFPPDGAIPGVLDCDWPH
jgi:hypothetical protein